MASYPTACRSEFCGKILCDGCRYRDAHAQYHRERGDLGVFEASQTRIRETERIVRETGRPYHEVARELRERGAP